MALHLVETVRNTGGMRETFAHEAVLTMPPGGDIRAPGAAVTVALCGIWEHEPPCPLAPHHCHADRVGSEIHVRILFAAEPDVQSMVRNRIDQALARGLLRGPDGVSTHWQVQSSNRSAVTDQEADHALRLAHS
jgi:hypothetical protein